MNNKWRDDDPRTVISNKPRFGIIILNGISCCYADVFDGDIWVYNRVLDQKTNFEWTDGCVWILDPESAMVQIKEQTDEM